MSAFLPEPDRNASGGSASPPGGILGGVGSVRLPQSRLTAERTYLGTLMALRPGMVMPKIVLPDSAFTSPARVAIRSALRSAWPYKGAGEVSERVLSAPGVSLSEFLACIVLGEAPGSIDLLATHLLSFDAPREA